MIDLEEIKIYLPHYLSADSQKELFQELKSFPNNIDHRVYSNYSDDDELIYQGDGYKEMLMVNLPSAEIRNWPAMVISNTCDLDLANRRISDIRVLYAPIMDLDKYKRMLLVKAKYSVVKIYEHIGSIRNQHISHIFYLPKGQGLNYEGIVFLDRIINCSRNTIDKSFIKSNRLFMLSNYGLYLFLVKLSINFTRIREGIDRQRVHEKN